MTFGRINVRGAKQPKRDPADPDYLTLTVVGNKLHVSITNKEGTGSGQSIALSEYNAWALIGLLSFFVGLKLPRRIMKEIFL